MKRLNPANPRPEFHGPKAGSHIENGPMFTLARFHRERRMNNLQAQRGSKSFSLNILPVSYLKSIF